MNIELYIDNQLCEINNANNLSIALKRQFINPSELSTKDAQKSYDITLPATTTNNHIFGFKNVEEVKGKFTRTYDAKLFVKGVKIFDGKFRLSQITKNSYKGNLGVPAGTTVKDIFGDTMMNQIQLKDEWTVDFDSFPESLSLDKTKDIPDCFYPYVLYGLLPKQPDENGKYTDKNIWDSQVKLSLEDFPPSINCLETVRRIFASKGYNVSGSAFSDERLKKLYMSYKNPTDYQQRWNYRKLADFKISGEFKNYIINERYGDKSYKPYGENQIVYAEKRDNWVANYNMLANDNLVRFSKKQDTLGNYNKETGFITAPASAVYEIELDANIELETVEKGIHYDTTHIKGGIHYYNMERFGDYEDYPPIELKLLRFTSDNMLDLSEEKIDRRFGKPNINQDNNNWNINDSTQFPKYFPKGNGTMVIDPAQNEKLICGFSSGIIGDLSDLPHSSWNYYNKRGPNILIGANGWSWNGDYSQSKQHYIAANMDGYQEVFLGSDEDKDEVSIQIQEDSDYKKRVLKGAESTIGYQSTNQLKGHVKVFVYLEKGEKLALVSSYRVLNRTLTYYQNERRQCIPALKVSFDLSICPVMYDKEFVDTITDASTVEANSDVRTEDINLADFLPSDVKINEWMDNFCKAFNLNLIQTDEKKFELNIKKGRTEYNQSVVDLDQKTHVNIGRTNTSFNLPSSYDIGFTIKEDEEGYVETKNKGSEIFETGNTEGNPTSQKSNFSYTWYKDIEYTEPSGEKTTLKLPVITDKEVWEDPVRTDEDSKNENYEEMMKKIYPNLAQRFWYKGDTFPLQLADRTVDIALTSNNIDGVIELDYTNNPNSILNNYFKILIDNDNHYTTVECYLTPEEYNKLPNSYVKFNGDLYYVAEIDKYDPTGNSKTTLKLIRKII